MKYVVWSDKNIRGLARDGLASLWTEVDENGVVHREIGFDAAGRIVYVAPTVKNPFGYFDNQIVNVVGVSGHINQDDFNKQWDKSCSSPETPD